MINEEQKILLIMTVGGSPEPLKTALKVIKPDIVAFFVSSGETSSDIQINDRLITDTKGNEILQKGFLSSEGCPPLEKTFTRYIAPDDADTAYKECVIHIEALRKKYPEHKIVADYTGGTKTMTGALLMACFANEDIDVQFMLGKRTNLNKIESGSEQPHRMSANYILAERDLQRIKNLVANYDYNAAFLSADSLIKKIDPDTLIPKYFKRKLKISREYLDLFAKWDRFKHKDAAKIAENSYDNDGDIYKNLDELNLYVPLMELSGVASKQANWRICADLWLNAIRRAEMGRYDDAIARLYRLLEAVVQSHLYHEYNIPNPIPADKVPDEIMKGRRPSWDKGAQYLAAYIGLDGSIDLIKHLNNDDILVKVLRNKNNEATYTWTSDRNHSILAHGFRSLDKQNWNNAKSWCVNYIHKFWQEYEPAQLPNTLPDF